MPRDFTKEYRELLVKGVPKGTEGAIPSWLQTPEEPLDVLMAIRSLGEYFTGKVPGTMPGELRRLVAEALPRAMTDPNYLRENPEDALGLAGFALSGAPLAPKSENVIGLLRYPGKKFAAGKEMAKTLEEVTGTYREPFVGSGTIFRQLFEAGKLKGKAILGEANPEVRNLYLQIKENPERVAEIAEGLAKTWKSWEPEAAGRFTRYVSELRQTQTDPAIRAGMDIFIGQHSRSYIPPWIPKMVKGGSFMSPEGIKNRILSVGKALKETEAEIVPTWQEALKGVGPKDYLALDPPYHTTRGYKASFKEEEELAKVLQEAGRRGAKGILWESGAGVEKFPGLKFEPTGKKFRGGQEEFVARIGEEIPSLPDAEERIVLEGVKRSVDKPKYIIGMAMKTKSGEIISGKTFGIQGKTHYELWDRLSLDQRARIADADGVVTNKGRYLTREEATKLVSDKTFGEVERFEGGYKGWDANELMYRPLSEGSEEMLGTKIPSFPDTEEALAFGRQATKPQIEAMQRGFDESKTRMRELLKQGKLNEAMKEGTKGQFLSEALQEALLK